MNVTYPDDAPQWGEGFALVQQATKQLEEILGRSAAQVKAEWDRSEDEKGRLLYTLRISDSEDSATASFSPEELTEARHARNRLRFLWDDLLKARFNRHFERAQAISASEN